MWRWRIINVIIIITPLLDSKIVFSISVYFFTRSHSTGGEAWTGLWWTQTQEISQKNAKSSIICPFWMENILCNTVFSALTRRSDYVTLQIGRFLGCTRPVRGDKMQFASRVNLYSWSFAFIYRSTLRVTRKIKIPAATLWVAEALFVRRPTNDATPSPKWKYIWKTRGAAGKSPTAGYFSGNTWPRMQRRFLRFDPQTSRFLTDEKLLNKYRY